MKKFRFRIINKIRCISYPVLLIGSVLLSACDGTATLQGPLTAEEVDEFDLDLNDPTGPVDYGDPWISANASPVASAAALVANPRFAQAGQWSNAGTWPISPIHLSLLPDGRVLSYGTNGTDDRNDRGAGFTFDLWTTGSFNPNNHHTLKTGIDTNLFCSAQTILPDGNVLISGGDKSSLEDKTYKLDGVNATTLYDTDTGLLTKGQKMHAPRWYPTLVSMPDGRQLVLGGKDHNVRENGKVIDKVMPAFPEIYTSRTGQWDKLDGATNAAFWKRNWFYPRAFLKDDGKVVLVDRIDEGGMDHVYELALEGTGSLRKIGSIPAGFAKPNAPAAMFDEGKLIFVDQGGRTLVVDISGSTVSYHLSSPAGTQRIWGNTTVLANGEVFLSGGRGDGSTPQEKLDNAVYKGQIWNPETGLWTDTAAGAKARLYHSTAILLPNARVLIAGGGPPGPVVNRNAERFLPPYLFNERGELAERPSIDSVGDVRYNNRFNVVLKNDATISKVTFIRAGSDTHSFDQGQRFMSLDFSQTGKVLDVAAPRNASQAPPGLYMLFVLNDKGAPSVAKLIMM